MTQETRNGKLLRSVLIRWIASAAAVSFLAAAVAQDDPAPVVVKPHRVMGSLDAMEADFHSLFPEGAQLEVLAEGFAWTEGPVWLPQHQCLLFSDIPRNTIFRWDEHTGLSVFLKPAGYTENGDGGYEAGGRFRSEPGTNGLLLDPQGRLVMCEHGNRRVSVLLREYDAIKQTLASHYDGHRLNSPNDAVFAPNGDLYFTDPPYGRPQRFDDPGRELDFCGVYRVAKSGDVQLVTRELRAPNGIGVSPDGKTLYVAQSDGRDPVWQQFDIQPDGSVANSRVLQHARPWIGKLPGGCDGLSIDRDGRLWATGPGGLYVIEPDGRIRGRILTGMPTSNCAFGEKLDGGGSMLYLTVNNLICRIPTRVQGLDLPQQK